MQLVTPRVVAIAVAIDTMSWIISFQVSFLLIVLIRKINFKISLKGFALKDCVLKIKRLCLKRLRLKEFKRLRLKSASRIKNLADCIL